MKDNPSVKITNNEKIENKPNKRIEKNSFKESRQQII